MERAAVAFQASCTASRQTSCATSRETSRETSPKSSCAMYRIASRTMSRSATKVVSDDRGLHARPSDGPGYHIGIEGLRLQVALEGSLTSGARAASTGKVRIQHRGSLLTKTSACTGDLRAILEVVIDFSPFILSLPSITLFPFLSFLPSLPYFPCSSSLLSLPSLPSVPSLPLSFRSFFLSFP